METRILTRRYTRGKVPCQQIDNLFLQRVPTFCDKIPDGIRKQIPSNKKISCECIEKRRFTFPKMASESESLLMIRQNVQNQYNEILRLMGNNVQKIQDQVNQELIQDDDTFKFFQSQGRKMLKKDQCTCEVMESDQSDKNSLKIYMDQNVIQRLDDYLTIN